MGCCCTQYGMLPGESSQTACIKNLAKTTMVAVQVRVRDRQPMMQRRRTTVQAFRRFAQRDPLSQPKHVAAEHLQQLSHVSVEDVVIYHHDAFGRSWAKNKTSSSRICRVLL